MKIMILMLIIMILIFIGFLICVLIGQYQTERKFRKWREREIKKGGK